jgi:predicted ATP-grasp superfamily ATP-dependent carboligase
VTESRGEPGISWVRMATDIPAAFIGLLSNDLDLKGYFRSLRTCNVEAVFSVDDIFPGLTEILLVPYLAFKRGF